MSPLLLGDIVQHQQVANGQSAPIVQYGSLQLKITGIRPAPQADFALAFRLRL